MSHTILGRFDGASVSYIRPYIEVSWTQNQAQNTSTVTATLYFHRYTNNYWSYNELTNSNGHSCTFSVGGSSLTQIRPFNLQRANPPNRVAIWTRTRTIEHNTNGTATVNISANGSTKVNPDTYSFGETVTLPTIPRETEINSVSMNNQLRPSVSNTLTVSLDRKHSSYTHRFEILNGTTELQSSTGNLVSSINITSTTVNKMIDLMTTVKSRDFTLRVVTLSSGTVIGRNTENFTVTLNDDYTRPVISSTSVVILGTGRDNDINKYVRGVSRARVQISATNFGRGATLQSMSANIGNESLSGTMVTDTLFRADTNVLSTSGNLTITMTVTNSRGQVSEPVTRQITVHAYNPPRITEFIGHRSDSNPTNVIISRTYSRSSLNGDNLAYPRIERREFGDTSWSIVNESLSLNTSVTITGNSESTSYEFRMVVYDSFGNEAVAELSIGTARVLMEKYKDVGISVGQRFDTNNPAVFQVGGDMSLRDEQDRMLNLLEPPFIGANLQNGWSQSTLGGYDDVGFYKIGGIVYLSGMISHSSPVLRETIFTLPEGFRPKGHIRIRPEANISGNSLIIMILTSGTVRMESSTSTVTWALLSSISFHAGG